MKLKKQKRISLICAIVLLLTTIVPNLALLESFAATATVVYNGTATYGGSTVRQLYSKWFSSILY